MAVLWEFCCPVRPLLEPGTAEWRKAVLSSGTFEDVCFLTNKGRAGCSRIVDREVHGDPNSRGIERYGEKLVAF